VTGIPASPPQRVVREEEQSANNPRITANSATFSRCTQYRIDDFVGWLARYAKHNANFVLVVSCSLQAKSPKKVIEIVYDLLIKAIELSSLVLLKFGVRTVGLK
jgi:hypothetical protein